jgi:hypothetical protein
MDHGLNLEEKALISWLRKSEEFAFTQVKFCISESVELKRQELCALCPYLLNSKDTMWNLQLPWTRIAWANFGAILLFHLDTLNCCGVSNHDDELTLWFQWNFAERIRRRITRIKVSGKASFVEQRVISTLAEGEQTLIIVVLHIILAINKRTIYCV